uniref:kinesin-like protein KIF9 n=1 Tax=Myxine glutinosa TaxID=7769 RepID=UPI00358E180C
MRDMLAAIHFVDPHMPAKPEMTNVDKKLSRILRGYAVDTKVEQDGKTLSRWASSSQATVGSSKHISEVVVQAKRTANKQDQKLQKKGNQKNPRLEQDNSKIFQETEEEERVVGELDCKNFAVGTAQKQGDITNLQIAAQAKMKLRTSGGPEEAKAFGSRVASSSEQSQAEDVSVESESGDYASYANIRPSTPPAPARAFEDFKDECGTEITNILKENRATLLQRHRKAKELGVMVNSLKRQIDYTTCLWEEKKRQRKDKGEMVAPSGQPVINEQELDLMLTLADLKGRYRTVHKKLLGTQAEVHYCQDVINKRRKRLLSEFTAWYQKSFLPRQDSIGSDEMLREFASSFSDLEKVSAKNEERGKFEQKQHPDVLVGELEESVFYKSKASAERQKRERAEHFVHHFSIADRAVVSVFFPGFTSTGDDAVNAERAAEVGMEMQIKLDGQSVTSTMDVKSKIKALSSLSHFTSHHFTKPSLDTEATKETVIQAENAFLLLQSPMVASFTPLQPTLDIAPGDLRLMCGCSAMETHFMKILMNSCCADVASRGSLELGMECCK